MKDVKIYPVNDQLYMLRVEDRKIKYFEGIWEIPEGMVYNAYLLKTPEGAMLFDTVKEDYADSFLEALFSLVAPQEIKHIVIHHMEPDHSGALPAVLQKVDPQVNVWGIAFTKRLLVNLYGLTPNFQTVREDNALEFGGHSLSFIPAPWLHWPETMVTHITDWNYLISGDIFGGYGIPEDFMDDNEQQVEDFLPLARKYFTTVIGHYKDYVARNFAQLEARGLKPEMILPAHGLGWRKHPERIYDAYQKWGEGSVKPGKIVVSYTSMYGFVERAIKVVIEDLKARGLEVEVFRYTDDHRTSLADFIGTLPDAQAVILATATYEGGIYPPMRQMIEEMIHKANFNKPLLIFASYGWAGAAGREMRALFEKSAYRLVDTIEYNSLLQEKDRERICQGIEKLLA